MTDASWKSQTKLEFPLAYGATLCHVGATNLFLDLQHKKKNTVKMRTCCLVPPEKLNPGKSPK